MSPSSARPARSRRTAAAAVALALLVLVLPVAGAGPAAAGIEILQTVAGVSGAPTSLTLAAAPTVVARGAVATLTGRLTDPSTGAGVGGAAVAVELLAPDGGWVAAATATTDLAGAVSLPRSLDATTSYRLHFGEPGAAEESTSQPVTVSVSDLTASSSATATRVGRPVTVSGVLVAGPGRALRLERQVGAGWQVLARTVTGEGGAYALRTAPSTPGFWRLRVARGPAAAPTVTAELSRVNAFRLHTYRVRTGGVVRADVEVVRAAVAATYADPRGWLGAHHRFRPAAPGRPGDLTLVLSQSRYLPSFSAGCSTAYSCRAGRYVVINESRWRFGSRHFPGTLDQYRENGRQPRDRPLAGPRPRVLLGARPPGAGDAAAVQGPARLPGQPLAAAPRGQRRLLAPVGARRS